MDKESGRWARVGVVSIGRGSGFRPGLPWLVLGAGTLIPWLVMATGRDDVEASESPLLLAVARQITHRPRKLYGPYGGRNPLVLIHAPLYYRLAALCAWPMARAGLDAETAARLAGRAISIAGLVATLAGAFFLARSRGCARGLPPWWAVLLAAATPIYGGLPFEVRPDMLGIAIQTWGVVLFFGALEREKPGKRAILLAFVCFALAACVKQHLVVAPAVSAIFLVAAAGRGRITMRTAAGTLLLALGIVLLYFGLEELASSGRMSCAAFRAAGQSTEIHPATWGAALRWLLVICWKCAG